MVAGKNAKATRVQWQAFVDAELSTEIRHAPFGDSRRQVSLERGDRLLGALADALFLYMLDLLGRELANRVVWVAVIARQRLENIQRCLVPGPVVVCEQAI